MRKLLLAFLALLLLCSSSTFGMDVPPFEGTWKLVRSLNSENSENSKEEVLYYKVKYVDRRHYEVFWSYDEKAGIDYHAYRNGDDRIIAFKPKNELAVIHPKSSESHISVYALVALNMPKELLEKVVLAGANQSITDGDFQVTTDANGRVSEMTVSENGAKHRQFVVSYSGKELDGFWPASVVVLTYNADGFVSRTDEWSLRGVRILQKDESEGIGDVALPKGTYVEDLTGPVVVKYVLGGEG